MKIRARKLTAIFALAAALIVGGIALNRALAQTAGDFSLQVSPSPLVAMVKPGQTANLELKVHNSGSQTEHLKIAAHAFKISGSQLQLDDTKQAAVAGWIHFADPTFNVDSGQTFTEKIGLDVPKDAGFSYSFALVIDRTGVDSAQNGGTQLQGSVAIFALINVDRPGAIRKVEVPRFATTQGIYEYLPAEFEIDFKNTGNTIMQPGGNIFVQRSSNDSHPIGTLLVNSGDGYILPGTTRTVKVSWEDGFQVAHTVTGADGKTSQQVAWNWNNLGAFRMGQYTAKLVAVYNDGQRDVPIILETTFWVIPWKILLGALVVLALIGFGVWSVVAKAIKFGKRIKR